jgi:hypothetical protein
MHETLVQQCGDAIHNLYRQGVVYIADRLGRLQRAAAREHTQPREQCLLARVQQVVAPIDRVADGLLALRQVAGSAGQELEAVGEAREQRLRGKELDPRRRQL